MKCTIHPFFEYKSEAIVSILDRFTTDGFLFGDGQRNKIKLFELEGKTINIKSFKIPHFINKIIYTYFRKSKARRSFEYATTLLQKGIGTPQPIAYFENYDFVGLKDSYYVCEHLDSDLTYRELVAIPDFPDNDKILRQFTRFSYNLHQKGVEFLDHSPGNTLIKKNTEGNYDFFLVDLNRMQFHDSMPFEIRMKNLCRLTPKKEMIEVMSNEYAKWYKDYPEDQIFEKMWYFTSEFQEKFLKKRKLKMKMKSLKK